MDSTTTRRTRWATLAALLGAGALTLGACSGSAQAGRSSAGSPSSGSSGSNGSSGSSASAPATTSCIPQGATAGDADSDNSGGPTDGDGCQ